jgi:hypothetical protein
LEGLVATAAQCPCGARFFDICSARLTGELGITTMERLDCQVSRRVGKSQNNCRSRHLMRASDKMAALAASLVICAALIGALQPAQAQLVPQGPKLVGTGVAGNIPSQGYSVALSADGNTAIVGGPSDNNNEQTGVGAAWVFTRSGGAWTQQGMKLTGNDSVGLAQQGTSVALSADGNTAAVGGTGDNSHGAVWVYTRSNGVWTQQGPKLVGTDLTTATQLGRSLAFSADGNTLIAGAPDDANALGAAVVFVRSNGVWTQQGPKLVGSGVTALPADQGRSVALSADGNTAAIGQFAEDSDGIGAAWVFTRSNGVWTQQGAKLVGTGGLNNPSQGTSVALSADGNTLASGGPDDNVQNFAGAVWVFTRSSGVWTQQAKVVPTTFIGAPEVGWSLALSGDGNTIFAGGPQDNNGIGAAFVFIRTNGAWTQQSRLVGAGAVGGANEGWSVALSADARTAIVGGYRDNSFTGAAWVYGTEAAHDFNSDGMSDIAWRDGSGNTAVWLMNGNQLLQAGGLGQADPTIWKIVGQRDFDGDGKADLLWTDTSGDVAIWFMNGAQVSQYASAPSAPGWTVVGTGDFNGDGKGDILWEDANGDLAIWLMNGVQISQAASIGTLPSGWKVAGTGDFDGDGKTDILFENVSGALGIWFMNGLQVAQFARPPGVPAVWSVVGTGDFNGDGKSDILWRDNANNIGVWLMQGASILQAGGLGNVGGSNWIVAETGDFNGDGNSDILWRDTSAGSVAMWNMSGTAVSQYLGAGSVPLTWTIQGSNAD